MTLEVDSYLVASREKRSPANTLISAVETDPKQKTQLRNVLVHTQKCEIQRLCFGVAMSVIMCHNVLCNIAT